MSRIKKILKKILSIVVMVLIAMVIAYLIMTYALESSTNGVRNTVATLTTTKITDEWKTTAPSRNKGTTRLQVVTSSERLEFTRRSEWAPLWIPFPDVVVKASAPIEIVYYVELDAPWSFNRAGDTLRVAAPPLKFNTPSIDTAGLKEWVADGSVFRRESPVQDDLRHALTAMATDVAREHLSTVRELAQESARKFVQQWLSDRFPGDAKTMKVEVDFAD